MVLRGSQKPLGFLKALGKPLGLPPFRVQVPASPLSFSFKNLNVVMEFTQSPSMQSFFPSLFFQEDGLLILENPYDLKKV